MSSAPPPLLNVNVTVPAWLAVDRARRRLDTIRSGTGRLATAAGAAAAAAGMFIDTLTGTALVADAVLTLGGLAALRLWKIDGHQKATASVLYTLPGVALAALLVAEQAVPGIHWWEALGLTVWTAGTWAVRPARVARQMVSPPPPAGPSTDLAPVEEPVVDAHPAALWWAQNAAGAAPGTVLEDVERTGDASMRAIIRSTMPGEPVPDISIRRLSALMDIPEDDIAITPVPGRGAGVRRLTIGQAEASLDPAAVWARRIAPVAMPGAVLVGVRVGRPGIAQEESN